MNKTPPPLLGFNNNVRHRGRIFHIQTEDSGVKRPHIITHLFGDGGRILNTVRTDYAEHVARDDMAIIVRRMMKEQHKAMFVSLRSGELDAIIEEAFGPAPADAPVARPTVSELVIPPAAGPEELAAKTAPLPTPMPQEWLPTPPSSPFWESPSAPMHDPPSAPEQEIPPLIVPPVSAERVMATAPTLPAMPVAPPTPLIRSPSDKPPKKQPPPLPQRAKSPAPRPPAPPVPREDTTPSAGVASSPERPPSAPRLPTPPPPSTSIGSAVEAMVAKAAGRPPRPLTPEDAGPLSQPPLRRRETPAGTPAQPSESPPDSPGRYSISRPAAIFGDTPPDSTRSLFGDPLLGEKSLDEVILSYLAEDLENPPK